MNLFVEWTQIPQNRKGRMISLTALGKIMQNHDPGYCSVYMFSEKDAKKIIDSMNSKGFDNYSLFSKFLVLDIDNGDEGLQYVEAHLAKSNLGYEVWSSGGKGYHIYIPHKLVESPFLPNSHKFAVIDLIPDAHEVVDMSLYQAGRLLSLPGRIHPKTKNRKVFMREVLGAPLILRIIPPSNFKSKFEASYSDQPLSRGLERALNLCLQPPSIGNRHTALWGAAKDLAESGLDHRTVLTIIHKVNQSWTSPKDVEEVEQAVNQAFRALTEK